MITTIIVGVVSQCSRLEIKGVAAQRSFFKDLLARLISIQQGMGLPSGRIELIAGLDIALGSNDATERWLAGEDVFAPARIVEGST